MNSLATVDGTHGRGVRSYSGAVAASAELRVSRPAADHAPRHHARPTGRTVTAVTDKSPDGAHAVEGEPSDAAEKPRHRVRLPRFIVQEPIGLGDVVKRGTTALGVHPCRGCQERAERINRWVGFEPRR